MEESGARRLEGLKDTGAGGRGSVCRCMFVCVCIYVWAESDRVYMINERVCICAPFCVYVASCACRLCDAQQALLVGVGLGWGRGQKGGKG